MRTVVTIAGMRSDHCKRAVFTALTPLAGIDAAEVSLGRITITHDGSVSQQDVRDAIAVTGYVIAGITEERRVLPIAGQLLQEQRF